MRLYVIYQTQGTVFHQIFKHRQVSWKTSRSRVFLTHFKVFGYLMKHCFECLIKLLIKLIVKCGKKRRKKIAKIYAN